MMTKRINILLFLAAVGVVLLLFTLVFVQRNVSVGRAYVPGVRGVMGDVVGAGQSVTIEDVTAVVRHIVRTAPLDVNNALLADVTCDGNINIWDVISIVRKTINPVLVYSCPPRLKTIGNRQITAGQELSFVLNAVDPESGVSVFSVMNLPQGSTVDSNTGQFRWTPTTVQVGLHSLTFIVTDDDRLIDRETISITVITAQQGTVNNDNQNSPLGVNLEEPRDYNPYWIFVDQFAKSRDGWIPTACDGSVFNTGQQLTLDSFGWVTDAPADICPATFMFNGNAVVYPPGTYVVLWEGDGALSVTGSGTNYQATGPGRATFEVRTASAGGIFLQIRTFNRANYIRNIRVIMPGGVCGTSQTQLDYFQGCATSRGGTGMCDSGETCYDFEQVHWNRFSDPVSEMNNPKVVFHPSTIQKLRPFKAMRYMNWWFTNDFGGGGSRTVSWNDVTSVQHRTQGRVGYGFAPIYLTSFSNLLNADAWINIPHQANDDYNVQMATFFRDNLNPNLKVYVEYTNEAWNNIQGYPQTPYMLRQEGCIPPVPPSFTWTNCPDFGLRYFSTRTGQIMDIWSAVYGSERASRLVRVMGGFVAIPSSNARRLDLAAGRVDALAIAPYFGIYNSDVSTWTLDQFFQELLTGGVTGQPGSSLSRVDQYVRDNAVVATQHSVELIAYEGGQHLVSVGNNANPVVVSLLNAANRDARMGQVYTQYLQNWRNAGGQIFMHLGFMAGQGGDGANWGLLENEAQTNLVKYDAVRNFIVNNPCWWAGCSTSGTPPLPPPPQLPVLGTIGNRQVVAGQTLSFVVSATDPENGALTYSATGIPSGATFNAATRQFSWTPTGSNVGTFSVTFTVTDTQNLQDSETVSITVTAATPPPPPAGSPTYNIGSIPFTVNWPVLPTTTRDVSVATAAEFNAAAAVPGTRIRITAPIMAVVTVAANDIELIQDAGARVLQVTLQTGRSRIYFNGGEYGWIFFSVPNSQSNFVTDVMINNIRILCNNYPACAEVMARCGMDPACNAATATTTPAANVGIAIRGRRVAVLNSIADVPRTAVWSGDTQPLQNEDIIVAGNKFNSEGAEATVRLQYLVRSVTVDNILVNGKDYLDQNSKHNYRIHGVSDLNYARGNRLVYSGTMSGTTTPEPFDQLGTEWFVGNTIWISPARDSVYALEHTQVGNIQDNIVYAPASHWTRRCGPGGTPSFWCFGATPAGWTISGNQNLLYQDPLPEYVNFLPG